MKSLARDATAWIDSLSPLVGILLLAGAAVAAALAVHWLAFRLIVQLAKRSKSQSDDILARRLAQPTRFGAVAIALSAAAQTDAQLSETWAGIAGFLMPALVGWIALAILHALTEAMTLKADISVANNLEARRRRTRLALLNRITSFAIVFIVVGLMLLSIPGVREVGLTLVASAGLAGLAVGAAAQPALKSVIAGVQMAVTEPINIDDVVIIDGEWGRIEQIRTTYVVVKVWDERRLIVPTSRFLEDTFQNWTKQTAELLGTVFLYLDPGTRVGPIREEFERQIRANERWDGRVQVVQVTDTKRDAVEVRLLMSAKDAPTLFDLRCDIREAMLEWMAENQPEAFARTRLVTAEPVEVDTGRALAA